MLILWLRDIPWTQTRVIVIKDGPDRFLAFGIAAECGRDSCLRSQTRLPSFMEVYGCLSDLMSLVSAAFHVSLLRL